MQRVSKLLASLLATAVVGAVICGCGSSNNSSASSKSTASESKQDIKIYYQLPSLQNPAYTSQKEGAEAEAKKLGVSLTVDAGSQQNGSAEEGVAKLENALTQKPSAVVEDSGTIPDQLQPLLEKAVTEGVKVVTVDVDIPTLKGKSTYVGLNDEQASATAGEYLNQRFPNGGEVGIVSCYVENPVTVARTKGFEAGIKKGKMHIADVVDAKCEPEKSRTMTENMLTSHPHLAAIWASTDIGALGAQKAVEAAGSHIPVLGHDGEPAALQSIASGKLTGTVWNPFGQYGEEAAKAAVEAVQGKTLPPQILLTSKLITKSNVSEYLK